MNIIPTIIALVAILTYPSKSQELSSIQQLTEGNHLFSAGVYKELAKKEKSNFLFSPFSAETVLSLSQEGAQGETAEELTNGLHLSKDKESTEQAFKTTLENFNEKSETYQLLAANKIYVANGFTINQNFAEVATNIYNSETENVNFSESQATADEINKWVEDKTNSKIKDLVSPDSLDAKVKILLVNALYFNGTWQTPFKKSNTKRKIFYTSETTSEFVETMYLAQQHLIFRSDDLDAVFLNLPYSGGNISMTVVLPNQKDGLSGLEDKIDNIYKDVSFEKELIGVHLPKFKIETNIEFIPILQKLGIKAAFDSNKADFSGIADNQEPLFISDVIQKAFVDVTEVGTEAAAATALIISRRRAVTFHPDIQHLYIDHPFIYFIKINDIVLFTGRVHDPNTKN